MDPQVEVELSAPEEAPPGAFDAALRVRAPEGWHLYWPENAGETGLATAAEMRVTGGAAGPARWSAPRLHVDPGPIRSFVWEPTGWGVWSVEPSAEEVHLKVELTWLACRELCVAGRATRDRTVRIRKGARPAASASGYLPREAPSATWQDGRLTVCLDAAPAVFPNAVFEASHPSYAFEGGRWTATIERVPGGAVVLVEPSEARGWRVELEGVPAGPPCRP